MPNGREHTKLALPRENPCVLGSRVTRAAQEPPIASAGPRTDGNKNSSRRQGLGPQRAARAHQNIHAPAETEQTRPTNQG